MRFLALLLLFPLLAVAQETERQRLQRIEQLQRAQQGQDYASAAEVATAVSDHAAAADPHPTYLTEAEGDADYQPLANDLTFLVNNCVLENDSTPIPDSCVGDGSDATGSGGVDTANSPNANEFARFTDADTIEGRTAAEARADLDLEVGTDIQALDSDLTAIAALTTTAHGRGLLDDADAAASRTSLSLGTAATSASTDFGPVGVDYLVGTANGTLTGEIAVGTSPGGELGGTWASPTLDDGITVDTWTLGSATVGSTAAANDNDTSLATTAFVQQEIDDVDLLSDNCVLENDSTPIPDSCVGDGTDDSGGGGGWTFFEFGSTTTNSTTTPTAVTGFTIPVTSGDDIKCHCTVITDAAATTTGVQITFAGPTATAIAVNRRSCSSTTAIINMVAESFGADNRTASAGTTSCTEQWEFTVRNATNNTDITASLDSEVGASNTSVFQESWCEYMVL